MEREFIPVNVAVLTVSDTRTLETDTSGTLIADRLAEVGHRIAARQIVIDSELIIRAQLAQWIADPGIGRRDRDRRHRVTPRDVTPEALRAAGDQAIPVRRAVPLAVVRGDRDLDDPEAAPRPRCADRPTCSCSLARLGRAHRAREDPDSPSSTTGSSRATSSCCCRGSRTSRPAARDRRAPRAVTQATAPRARREGRTSRESIRVSIPSARGGTL